MFGWQDEVDDDFHNVLDPDPMSTFNRRGAMRESARLAWAMEDSHRRVRAALLRRGGTEEEVYRPGDLIAFKRKQKTGGWIGPARVLATEGKNLWILHSGIPILVASNRVRAANAEEHLENELLDKSRLSRKRPFMDPEAVRQPHRLDDPGQQPYLDMRGGSIGGGPSGADHSGGEGSSKRIKSGDEGDASPVRSSYTPSIAASSEAPARSQDIEELLDAEVEKSAGPLALARPIVREQSQQPPIEQPHASLPSRPDSLQPEEQSQQQAEQHAAETATPTLTTTTPRAPTVLTPLAKAMAIDGGNRLDVGVIRSRAMRTERTGPYERIEPQAEDEEVPVVNFNFPEPTEANMLLAKEFVCFMVKRKNKSDTHKINYGRASDEMKEKLNESRAKEWSNWLKYKAIRFPTQAEVEALLLSGEAVIPMRWVDVDKNEKLRAPGSTDIPLRLKSRLAGDISAAFLQGAPIQRILLLSAPRDGIPVEGGPWINPEEHMIALMSVYGSKDAPRGFWLELRQTILDNGVVEIEPAFYALIHEGECHGLLVTHVDDLLWTGTPMMDEVMKRVQERFTFGATEEGSFRFCGRKIVDNEEYISVSSPETLSKVKPIHIDGGRQREPSASATATEQSQMRAVLGSIGWVARLCRPELCYGCSSLQGKQSKPLVEDLRNTNKLLAAAQKTKDNGIRFYKGKFNFETAILLSVTDASHAAETGFNEDGKEQGHRSQSGRFLLLCGEPPAVGKPAQCHILEWQSQTLKRVCRSTLQAEVLSSMLGSEAAQQVRILLYSLKCPRPVGDRGMKWKTDAADSKKVLWYSDCRSFIDYMSGTTPGSITDKRMAIDMTALRQELWRGVGEEIGDPSASPYMPAEANDQLWWICTADMLSDELTKSMRWDSVRSLCDTGYFPLSVSKIRCQFFRHFLNWIDFVVVCSSWVELFAAALPISPTFLRMLRLGKLLRAVRVVRLSQVLESLQLLLMLGNLFEVSQIRKCIAASLKILFWSLVLLMVIQCSAGMTISYMLSDFMVTDDGNEEARFQVYRYYGTFSKRHGRDRRRWTLLTMFEVLFANWAPACRVLIDNASWQLLGVAAGNLGIVSEWYSVAFIVYRLLVSMGGEGCFVGFAVLNVVNAVFVQSTMKVALADEEIISNEKARSQEAYRRRVKSGSAHWDLELADEVRQSGSACCELELATKKHEEYEEEEEEEKEEEEEEEEQDVNHIFRQADVSGLFAQWVKDIGEGDGIIDLPEFIRLLEHPQLQVWLHLLELDTTDLFGLFKMLDDGDGEISVDTCLKISIPCLAEIKKMKGTAKSLDLHMLAHNVMKMNAKVDALLGSSGGSLQKSFGTRSLSNLSKPKLKTKKL
eukprot:s404_g18.t1